MRTLLLIALILLIIGGFFNIFPASAGSGLVLQRIVGVLSVLSALYLLVRLLKP